MKTAQDLITFFTEDKANNGGVGAPLLFADPKTYLEVVCDLYGVNTPAGTPEDGITLTAGTDRILFRPVNGMDERDKGKFWTARVVRETVAPTP